MRAQYFSFDTLLSSFAFILLFATMLIFWINIQNILDNEEKKMASEALRISEVFLKKNFISPENKKIMNSSLSSIPYENEKLKEYFNTIYNVSISVKTYTHEEILYRGINLSDAEVRKKINKIISIRRVFALYFNETDETLAYADFYIYK